MIKIHQGYVSESEIATTLSTEIDIGDAKKIVQLSVEKDYGKFFSPERADYALAGMLAYALRNKHDIICEAPVTEELLYNIRELLIPTFVRTDSRGYSVKIQAEIAPPLDKLPVAETTRRGGWYWHFLRRRQFLYCPETFQFRISQPKINAPLHLQQRLIG